MHKDYFARFCYNEILSIDLMRRVRCTYVKEMFQFEVLLCSASFFMSANKNYKILKIRF